MIAAVLRSRTTWIGAGLLMASAVHLWIWGLIDLTSTVSLVEAEWTVSAAIGVVYSADFIRDNLLDWDSHAGSKNDRGNQLTIEILLLVGWVLIGLHLLLLTFGVVVSMRPTTEDPASLAIARPLDVGLTVVGQSLVGALMVIRLKRAELRSLTS